MHLNGQRAVDPEALLQSDRRKTPGLPHLSEDTTLAEYVTVQAQAGGVNQDSDTDTLATNSDIMAAFEHPMPTSITTNSMESITLPHSKTVTIQTLAQKNVALITKVEQLESENFRLTLDWTAAEEKLAKLEAEFDVQTRHSERLERAKTIKLATVKDTVQKASVLHGHLQQLLAYVEKLNGGA